LPVLQQQVARDVASIAAPYGPIFEAELTRSRRLVQAPKLRDCLVTYYDYRRRKGPEIQKDAQSCFHNVSARQPDLAQAWSGLAMLYMDNYAAMFGRGGDVELEAGRDATEKALALDAGDFLGNLAPVLRRRPRVPPGRRTNDRVAAEQRRGAGARSIPPHDQR
jgi:hypothetical protein